MPRSKMGLAGLQRELEASRNRAVALVNALERERRWRPIADALAVAVRNCACVNRTGDQAMYAYEQAV